MKYFLDYFLTIDRAKISFCKKFKFKKIMLFLDIPSSHAKIWRPIKNPLPGHPRSGGKAIIVEERSIAMYLYVIYIYSNSISPPPLFDQSNAVQHDFSLAWHSSAKACLLICPCDIVKWFTVPVWLVLLIHVLGQNENQLSCSTEFAKKFLF